MATPVFKQDEQNQQGAQPTLPGAGGTSGAPASGTGGAGVSGTAPSSSPSGGQNGSGMGFVNLQNYLQGYSGVDDQSVKQLTDSSKVDKYVSDVGQTMLHDKQQSALDQANRSITDPNTGNAAPGLSAWLNTSGQSAPTAPTKPGDFDPSKYRMGGGWNPIDQQEVQRYTSDLDAYNKSVDKYNSDLQKYQSDLAAWKAQNTQTPVAATNATAADAQGYLDTVNANAGVNEKGAYDPSALTAALDRLQANKPGYTSGAGALDSYLMSNDANASKQLQDYRGKYSNLLGLIQSGSLPVAEPSVVVLDENGQPVQKVEKKTPGYNTSTGPGGGGGTSAGY